MEDNEGFPITALREIKYLKEIKHKNVVDLLDIITSKPSQKNKYRSSFYLVFEYLNNDLQGLIDKQVAFTLNHVSSIMIQVLQGTIFLHSRNIVHRDIKGANILISKQGIVQIADFGLARVL